jgi:hypothetical protein
VYILGRVQKESTVKKMLTEFVDKFEPFLPGAGKTHWHLGNLHNPETIFTGVKYPGELPLYF